MRSPVHRRATAVLLTATLLIGACGDDDDQPATSDTTTTSAAPTTADDGDETTTTTRPAPEEDESTIEVTVSGGSVTGGGRHRVPLGHTVNLRVTSDQADEVHLHGYDLAVDLEAGSPAVLTFDATIPGVFEAELHDAAIVLVELEIS
jgi:hypothetical protein